MKTGLTAVILFLSLPFWAAAYPIIDEDYYSKKLESIDGEPEVSHLLPDALRLSLFKGEERKLEVAVLPEGAPAELTWACSGGAVSVRENPGGFIIKAVSPGSEHLRITAKNGVFAIVHITIKEITPCQIAFSGAPSELRPGEAAIIRASVLPENAGSGSILWRVKSGREHVFLSFGDNLCKIRAESPGRVLLSAELPGENLSSTIEIPIAYGEKDHVKTDFIASALISGALLLLFPVFFINICRRRRGKSA